MEARLAPIFGEKVTAMTEEIVFLSIPRIELKALIVDCLSAVLEDRLPAPQAATGREILSVDALSEYAGLSKDAIYRKAGRGEIPHAKRGKRLYFDRAEIDAWLMARKVAPQAIATAAAAYERKRALPGRQSPKNKLLDAAKI